MDLLDVVLQGVLSDKLLLAERTLGNLINRILLSDLTTALLLFTLL